MEKRSAQKNQRRRRARERRMIAAALPVIALAVLAAALSSLWGGIHLREDAAPIPGGSGPALAVFRSDPAEYTEDQDPQPPAQDTDWNLTLVNKWNPLPEDYEVSLVEVPGGEKVDERIYDPLMEMLEDAKEGNLGQLPLVVSGYRTQETQQQLYDEKIAEYRDQGYSEAEAAEQAEQWVAVPGHSEHQLGFAVDINGATYDLYLWLQENSYKYGFIFRYPGNKTDITGTAEEVWHYRYVGVEAAAEMYEQGLCLEEYLGCA